MVRIRDAQIRVFSEAMQRSLELRMLTHLRVSFPAVTEEYSDQQIVRIITQGINSASQYGIVEEADVQRYLKYMFIYGLDFDANLQTARMGGILRTDSVVGSKKLDRIDEYELSATKQS